MSTLDEMRASLERLLDANTGDPEDWPLYAKMRLLALLFDYQDFEPDDNVLPVGDGVQRDINEVADILEALASKGDTNHG